MEKTVLRVPIDQWKWRGYASHFICSFDCRFHLATEVGDYLVSTVGEYFPDEGVRNIIAESRGIELRGKGDERKNDYLKKIGYEWLGSDRKYETMVFKLGQERCVEAECGCSERLVEKFRDLAFLGYMTRREATEGHYALCLMYAAMDDSAEVKE